MQLLHLLEACLTEKSDSLHNSAFYELFTQILTFTESKPDLKLVNESLWKKLNDVLLEKSQLSEPSQSFVLRRMVVLMDNLLLPSKHSEEKKNASPQKVG